MKKIRTMEIVILATLLFSSIGAIAPKVSEQKSDGLITATGEICISEGQGFETPVHSISFTFNPAGGPINGTAVWNMIRTLPEGTDTVEKSMVLAGNFEGGDGGHINGTLTWTAHGTYTHTDGSETGHDSDSGTGTWEGNLHSDGTGEGYFSSTCQWHVTFSAEAFQAGLTGSVPGAPVPPKKPVLTETEGLFGIPWGVLLASLGIPLAGAITGAMIAAVLSALSSVNVSTNIVYQKADFYSKFNEFVQQKLNEGYFIKNPGFVDSPNYPEIAPALKDSIIAGNPEAVEKGLRCGEATKLGEHWLKTVAQDTFGKDTIVTDIVINREGITDNWDINHIALRLILPNGERIIADVHESLIAKKAVLYNERDWVAKYGKIIGGNITVNRSYEEDTIVNLINKYKAKSSSWNEQQKWVEELKADAEGKFNYQAKNKLVYDRLIKSYMEFPPSDPPLHDPFENWPNPNPNDLTGKVQSGRPEGHDAPLN
jgi:hypothetical protein